MMRRLLAALALTLAAPAGAEPPPAMVEATEAATGICVTFGGAATILDGYQRTLDLNGDGIDDFITDQGRLECAGAWSALCGPSGCPVTAWLSTPDGGHDRFDFGRLLDFAIREGAPPAVVARYAALFCGDAPVESCTRTWTFGSNAPEMPPLDPVEAAEPKPVPRPAPAADASGLAGWTLRRVPGASPVALGMGTGDIATLAAFCLSGQPFLAVTLHDRPAADRVALGFGFSDGPVDVEAGFEATAGGAFVVALGDGPLAARLAGRDRTATVSIDGAEQGVLSLSGSTRSLRGALTDCHGF